MQIEPEVKVDYVYANGRHAYDIFFPKEFLAPAELAVGGHPGMAIKVLDRNDMRHIGAKQAASEVTCTKDPNDNPHTYTQLIFVK